ncbi:L-Aspartase-like protein [Dendryphion nanum]|uniref:L-Aspartase-like protein n=1 Tax=Dendryphion nanum TaxID=256645 RepID=A0A9P9E009_9PLEO|nr:L-Aspartase-like protein [Dendryphion nanum]
MNGAYSVNNNVAIRNGFTGPADSNDSDSTVIGFDNINGSTSPTKKFQDTNGTTPNTNGTHSTTKPTLSFEFSHTNQSSDQWNQILQLRKSNKVVIDGSDLDIASVIAVAKFNVPAYISTSPTLLASMNASVHLLESYLSKGYCVYGVNTGFGGSADTRTTDLPSLQSALLQLTQAGILSDADTAPSASMGDPGFHSMPVPWVRAMMLIRCNNALRGHSGVRIELISAILRLMNSGMTPVVPLRGSISASGDLMPLSYVAGVLEGNPDIAVRVNNGKTSTTTNAREALTMAGLEPFILGPKEGLGLINGTAASAAVGCFAMHEANKLAVLSQMLVAMSCEALQGNAQSYHPFIAEVRPHPGQIECAKNVLQFLQGSGLATSLGGEDRFKPGLFQDRYALRGTPQWLGPQLEDLSAVLKQLTIELNSTSDNPLIDVKTGSVYSGANFIASSVASGMEKSRLSLSIIGRLLFSLSSELINPTLNRGLPPNLAADDPSLSFTMKGVDISMAAYMSELGFLANPVTSHVQSAESNNQQINSLALISGRYTLQAATIVAQMCAAHLFAVCQALDLRVLHMTFLRSLFEKLWLVAESLLPDLSIQQQKEFQQDLYSALSVSWNTTTPLDLDERCDTVSAAGLPILVGFFSKHNLQLNTLLANEFQQQVGKMVKQTFTTRREEFFGKQNTIDYLGGASTKLYSFIRVDLGVPFHQGLVEHPARGGNSTINGRPKRTVGSWVSVIFAAICDDRIWKPMAEELGGWQPRKDSGPLPQ